MADGTLDQRNTNANGASQVLGLQWYIARWSECGNEQIAAEKLAKAESLVDAARGIARILAADSDAQGFNAENDESFLPTLPSLDRGALGVALLDLVDHAQLVFLQSQQPLRLSSLLGGTQLARALRRRNAEGMAIAGCGAGAALLCEHMLAHGSEGATPRTGGASLAPGLGLTNRVVVDQGGHASDRLGRLLAALALNPFALGLGLDAATAAVIGPDNVLEVIGFGGVTMIDPAEMAESNVADLAPGAPIRITNLRLHALTGGARYDLDFRRTVG